MSLDKFGRISSTITRDEHNNWNFQNKRIVNVAESFGLDDVVTKRELKNFESRINLVINSFREQIKTSTITRDEYNNWDFQNKRIVNVAEPRGLDDVVTNKELNYFEQRLNPTITLIQDDIKTIFKKLKQVETTIK